MRLAAAGKKKELSAGDDRALGRARRCEEVDKKDEVERETERLSLIGATMAREPCLSCGDRVLDDGSGVGAAGGGSLG